MKLRDKWHCAGNGKIPLSFYNNYCEDIITCQNVMISAFTKVHAIIQRTYQQTYHDVNFFGRHFAMSPSSKLNHVVRQTHGTVSARANHMHFENPHYSDVIIGSMASQIATLTIVYSCVYSGADQRKHQSSASLAFVRGIHWWLVNSPHEGPVTRKMFPFDDVIMKKHWDRLW